jgi:signal transduction histidine kinase
MSRWLWAAHLAAFSGAALVCFTSAHRARRQIDGRAGVSLAAFLIVTGVWAGVETLRLAAPSFEAKMVLYPVALVVGLGAVYAWLWFCVTYTETAVPWSVTVGGALALAVVSLVKLTNPVHGWYFEARLASDPFVHLAVAPTALHWVVTAGAYVAAGAGFLLLFRGHAADGRDTRGLTALVLLLALPVVPDFAALAWPDLLPSLFYEPLGAAVFAVGALVVLKDEFGAVARPARYQLAETLDLPVVVVDPEGRVMDYSAAAAALFPSLAAGSAHLDEVDPRLAVDDEGVITVQTDDGPRFFLRRSAPVETAGQSVGRTVVLSDVTDLEATRRELDRQNEQLDEFAAAITHELRNPLNLALGHLSAAPRSCSNEDCRRAVDAAYAANERMVDIVDDLTTMTTYGKSVPDRADHPLPALVRQAWQACDPPAARLDIVGSATAAVDRPRFVEMCERTFQFCLARGATTVTVVTTDEGFRVETDLDPLDPTVADRLFAYGQQAADDDRLGLALVDTLAAAQGWTVRIDPDAPGLQFTFASVAPLPPSPSGTT